MKTNDGVPLVRERSRVQSSLAAPLHHCDLFDLLELTGVKDDGASDAKCANAKETCRVERGESGALTPLEITHFWARVSVGKNFECWSWTDQKNPKGYGRSHGTMAHRITGLRMEGKDVLRL